MSIKLYCSKCFSENEHSVNQSLGDTPIDFSMSEIEIKYDYQIVRCLRCKSISYNTNLRLSSKLPESGEIETISYNLQLPTPFTKQPKTFDVMPEHIKLLYLECLDLYRLSKYKPALTVTRIILEACCKEKFRTERISHPPDLDLAKMIRLLAKNNVINEDIARLMKKLKNHGNEASHFSHITTLKKIDKEIQDLEKVLGVFFNVFNF